MKALLLFTLVTLAFATTIPAQKSCSSFSYKQKELKNNPGLAEKIAAIEAAPVAVQNRLTFDGAATSGTGPVVIKIPVVVHILYHTQEEKMSITDAVVIKQLETLNNCFRHQNADSVNTPSYFKKYAADCEIEFQLAKSTPKKAATTGIIRKYTPVTEWTSDDKVKFAAETGDDAWDSKSYLNIWICNLGDFAGYSSFPGEQENKDGLVISFSAFGENLKTVVHEAGHWLNLKHLWGDENCGDDGVADTPKQASYTPGCPSGIRVTCGNGPNGDIYSNYMDFTSDECTNLFTLGQKARMKALFAPGGARYAMLSSAGLNNPLIFEVPLPDEDPKWLHPQLYPNPAASQMTLDLSYDTRWIGKPVQVMNLTGQVVMTITITSKTQVIDISRLQPAMYFLVAKKSDGESIKQKFIKL